MNRANNALADLAALLADAIPPYSPTFRVRS
jgi:hypothetical protein